MVAEAVPPPPQEIEVVAEAVPMNMDIYDEEDIKETSIKKQLHPYYKYKILFHAIVLIILSSIVQS